MEVVYRQIKKAAGIKLSEEETVGSHEAKFVQEDKTGEKTSLFGNLRMTRSRLRSKTKRNAAAEREGLGG